MHKGDLQGLQAIFLDRREVLARFLAARGAGDAVDDLLQELWLKLDAVPPGPVAKPLPYLFRAAENLMRDRYRSERQARLREGEWTDASGPARRGVSDAPSGERALIAREELAQVAALLGRFPARAQDAFRLHRLAGLTQRAIADRLGVSLSTIEKDLRDVYQALVAARNASTRPAPEESVIGRKDGR